ncbi:hypothetical protein QK313_00190 [Klebsiella michiganensis]|uniref:hypothetical protein n=1 Tax=Klebsiella michiganensis TaxID=1134687 RepID=UPI00249AE428|nr:hypothetical protein [Klebsiella michiganensis]MDI3166360.1 hypothetical protein [Klebsiella michiganensis]
MTKSTITRERLEKIKSWRETYGAGSNVMLLAEEAEELASIALAAMDGEPNRNPVLPYADSYRDMAKQGVELVPIWSVITDLERNIAPLYRHAQQPVVQPMMFIDGDISSEDADKLAKVIREFNEEDERPLAKMARIIRENPHPTNECDMPKAQTAPVTERDPIAWLNDAYLARGVVDGEAGSEDAGPGYIPVYREAGPQPAPVVQCVPLGDSPYDVPHSMPSNLRELIAEEIGILFSDDDAQSVWDVCRRAAMLSGGKS